MGQDALLESATSHWAPRLVSNGVLLTDFQEVTAGISRWDDWCAAWCRRAQVHEELGHEAYAQDCRLTGAQHLSRAALYYHFAKFVFVHDLDQMRAAQRKSVECKTLALPHLRPSGERVEIPYQGSRLAGILRKPPGVQRPPVLVMLPGLDSTKEELEAYEGPFLERGMATLLVDGPGQGEAEEEFPIRGDYEVAVTAVVDFLLARADIDGARIGLWGVSLGGYYAPRAAAFEKRIKACIGVSGPYGFAENWDAAPELTRVTFRVRSRCRTPEEARLHAATLTLGGGVARQIACPLFIVIGRQDRIVPWQSTMRIAQEAAGPVETLVVEDGGHNANNRPYRYRMRTADWMARQLGIPPQ